jgi:outer membrane immunogenic protein
LGLGEVKANTNWIGTIRGRLGYLVNPNFLVYGTGGLAYGGVTASSTNYVIGRLVSATETPSDALNQNIPISTIPGQGNISATLVGWTAGGGVEWMASQNWSIKAEALYYDLGSVSMNSSPIVGLKPDLSAMLQNNLIPVNPSVLSSLFGYNVGAPATANVPVTRVRFDGVIVRAGVNYHFNFSAAPVVAKY